MKRNNKPNKSDRDETCLKENSYNAQYIYITRLPELLSKKIDLHLLVFLYYEMKTFWGYL